jgi:predicted  nucleic acid-binding Zn-ribbon protein
MPATIRNTSIAGQIEEFLDENEENLPPVMYGELEDVAESIDREVEKKEELIESLEEQVEDLQERIKELEEQLDVR